MYTSTRQACCTIQGFVRSIFARRERQTRAIAKQNRIENGAALAVQRIYRVILAMKRMAKRKKDVLQAAMDKKKQEEREKVAKMRQIQKDKKKAAMAAMAAKRAAKQAKIDAEKARRGY
tara:strand:+ start:130 stop:486 length:357 start_codon:yes stop_codon:yes gene_type:complete